MEFSGNKGFVLSAGRRWLLLILATLLCFIMGSVLVGIIVGSSPTGVRMRLAIIVQDLFVFILPALIVAVMVTRRPADFLRVRKAPRASLIFLTVLTLIAAAPAMNWIIELNKGMHLPESMSAIEELMRSAEESAAAQIELLTNNFSIGGLIVSILIIGVMAGFSEELYFRGTMQRIFASTPMNCHVAIWATAVIFSAMHMQFFGFFPRMLLGAFLGYLTYWSGSLWLAVIAHAVNNSMAVIIMWMNKTNVSSVNLDEIGTSVSDSAQLPIVAFSVLLTALLLWRIKRTA